jgi:hypothetical protein
VALAPAAVEDCLCALRYINNQAKTYDIDTTRIVVTGESAGGHLALPRGFFRIRPVSIANAQARRCRKWRQSLTGSELRMCMT